MELHLGEICKTSDSQNLQFANLRFESTDYTIHIDYAIQSGRTWTRGGVGCVQNGQSWKRGGGQKSQFLVGRL